MEFFLIMVVLALAVWLLPVILIAMSSTTRGLEKLVWVLAVLFVSWFAWILYLLFAPVDKDR